MEEGIDNDNWLKVCPVLGHSTLAHVTAIVADFTNEKCSFWEFNIWGKDPMQSHNNCLEPEKFN